MLKIKDVLKQLNDEDIIEIMLELGFDYPSSSSNEMIFESLCCHSKGGNKHKLYCYSNEKGHSFYCFICMFRGNICDIIMHIKNVSFEEAFTMIRRVSGITSTYTTKNTFGSVPMLSDDYWNLLNSYRVHRKTEPKMEIYSENVLALFSNLYHYSWIKEHITTESMERFGIGYYIPQNSITIPHRDIEGNLIGIRRRAMDEAVINNGFKYMPIRIGNIEYKHPLSFNLFGAFENKETIKKIKKVCIFESEKSVMQVDSYYPNNNWSLAMCGSSLSNAQRKILLSLEVEEVILCIDKDWETREDSKYKLFKRKYMSIAKKLAPYVNFYIVDRGMEDHLELKDSPSDKGKESFEALLKQKKLITLEMIQRYFSEER